MKRIRDAAVILPLLDRGEVVAELSRVLNETLRTMVEQSADRPKVKIKGKVSLTLDLVMESGAVQITADISARAPKPPRRSRRCGPSFFWTTAEGELTTEHPTQIDMFQLRAAREAGGRPGYAESID